MFDIIGILQEMCKMWLFGRNVINVVDKYALNKPENK
jgi:hypothetical protein